MSASNGRRTHRIDVSTVVAPPPVPSRTGGDVVLVAEGHAESRQIASAARFLDWSGRILRSTSIPTTRMGGGGASGESVSSASGERYTISSFVTVVVRLSIWCLGDNVRDGVWFGALL